MITMYHRTDRISEEMKREISSVIRDLKDPRVHELTSVIAVRVTKDLRYAKVFVSVLADEEKRTSAVKGLNAAAGFIRKELGARMELRYTPELTFVSDSSIEYGAHINKILNEIDK